MTESGERAVMLTPADVSLVRGVTPPVPNGMRVPLAPEAPPSSVLLARQLGPERWTNAAFLNGLRQVGDEVADQCALEMAKIKDGAHRARKAFEQMKQNDSRLPDDAPEPLKAFFASESHWCDRCRQPSLPAWVDRDRVIRGQEVFMQRMAPAVLVLLCKSLPEGYATAGATKILNISGELLNHTYHRLMGTLELLVNVSSPEGFERPGLALVNALQMRLLHAGVRSKVAPVVLERREPGGYAAYVQRFGVPVNQEDMLATIMAFSLLVVRGLRTLGVPLDEQEAEDFYYVWRVFAHEMGIHPPTDAQDDCHLPKDLTEAAAFYEAYRKRQYVGATTRNVDGWCELSREMNPDGVALAQRHMIMLATALPPRWAHLIDLADVMHIYVEMLIGEEGCARVGIPRLEGHWLLRLFLAHFAPAWAKGWGRVNFRIHDAISRWFLRHLVQSSYSRGVVFTVPATVADLKNLVNSGANRGGSMAVRSV